MTDEINKKLSVVFIEKYTAIKEPCTTSVVNQSDEMGTLFWLFFKNNFGKAPFLQLKMEFQWQIRSNLSKRMQPK